MLLSIGKVRSTTRLNLSWTASCAAATDAVADTRDTRTSVRAFIMVDLPRRRSAPLFFRRCRHPFADRAIIGGAAGVVLGAARAKRRRTALSDGRFWRKVEPSQKQRRARRWTSSRWVRALPP